MKDNEYMQMAIEAAKQAQWRTWKNPRVGAVIVKEDTVLAVGYHHQYGDVHAEIDAYQQVTDKDQLVGATIYVTLEPCAHTGKQPSCASQMLAWGLKRVVVGQIDPNPLVTMHGIERLRTAGVQVDIWPTPVSEVINPAFHYFFTHQLPYVTLKVAQSFNGKINGAPDEATKITTAEVDVDSHRLRAYQQAIVVGSATALIDQPSLAVRNVSTDHQPLRVIIDRRGRLAGTDQVHQPNTLVITENEMFAAQYEQVQYQATVTPQSVRQLLGGLGIQAMLVEGGSELHAAFVAAQAYQTVVVYQTTTVLPNDGLSSFASDAVFASLGNISDVTTIDNTLKITLKPEEQ